MNSISILNIKLSDVGHAIRCILESEKYSISKMPPISFGLKFNADSTEGALVHILDDTPLSLWSAYAKKSMEDFEGATAMCIAFLIENDLRDNTEEIVAFIYDSKTNKKIAVYYDINFQIVEISKDFTRMNWINVDYTKSSKRLYDIATFGKNIINLETESSKHHFNDQGKIKQGIFFSGEKIEI